MTLRVESYYKENQYPTLCVLCGRSTGGQFSPPVQHVLVDDGDRLGEVCERCAYGSIDLWRMLLTEYAIRLETKAAVLRSLASRLEDAEPAPEGISEDLVRGSRNRRPGGLPGRPRPPYPPFRFGD